MSIGLQDIVSLCKQRGFVYQSSEVYGGFAAVYDYGPYGVELSNAIKSLWWKRMVRMNHNIVGLDSGIFMHPKIWEASGHVGGFADPMSECKNCHTRVRVDTLLEEISVVADDKMTIDEINELFAEHKHKLKCPGCKKPDFTEAKAFNLLVMSNLGNFTSDTEKNPVYLRGETCQGIFVNFKNVLDSQRQRIPFGIAQIGKAFRNEITARQFIFRTREFEQMEMQYFVSPDAELEEFEKWRQTRWDFYHETLGVSESNLRWHEHDKLAFYAKAAWDIEFNFPFGFAELEGLHARGNYDLTQHTTHSGKKLEYRDPFTQKVYTPHVVETSAGVARTFLAVLSDAYCVEDLPNGSTRTVLKLNRNLAPVKAAVFPLKRNNPQLVEMAHNIYKDLCEDFAVEFDDNGNVGKRYRRQDEIGTPFCMTVDFQSLDDSSVTVRDRDTMEQIRVNTDQLASYLTTQLKQ